MNCFSDIYENDRGKMNRGSFLKSLVTLIAAPSLIAVVDDTNITYISNLKFKPVFPPKQKVAVFFKIANQMLEDDDAMEFVVKEIEYRLKNIGGDPDKPYLMEIGYEEGDFEKNIQTCLITQFI